MLFLQYTCLFFCVSIGLGRGGQMPRTCILNTDFKPNIYETRHICTLKVKILVELLHTSTLHVLGVLGIARDMSSRHFNDQCALAYS